MHVTFVGYSWNIQGIFLYSIFPERYFGNIPRNFIGNFFQIFQEYIMGMSHEYSTNMHLPGGSKTTQKPLTERLASNDQMDTFRKRDTIASLADLNKTTAPDCFQFKKSNDHELFYNLVFDVEIKFPKILESIKVDSNLQVQLQYYGITIPLPHWFVQGHNTRLKNVSMLENLYAHIRNVAFDNYI